MIPLLCTTFTVCGKLCLWKTLRCSGFPLRRFPGKHRRKYVFCLDRCQTGVMYFVQVFRFDTTWIRQIRDGDQPYRRDLLVVPIIE